MSSSAINAQLFQAKIGSIQNQADSSSVYSAGVWSFKNSTALTSVTITDAGAVTLGPSGFTGNHVVNGNVGIGTASPTSVLDVNGISNFRGSLRLSEDAFTYSFKGGTSGQVRSGIQFDGTNSLLAFYTGQSERMRINANGDILISNNENRLGIGNTASSFGGELVRLSRNTAASSAIFEAENRSTSYAGTVAVLSGHRNTVNGTWKFLECIRQGFAYAVSIYDSGTINNATGSYSAYSDIKLKENIQDASPKLDKLKQVRIVNYNLKADPDKTKMLGVVAQEVEQIFPGLVHEEKIKNQQGEETEETIKSVKYSIFVPMLIKAMQEQQEIIDALEARLAALEAK